MKTLILSIAILFSSSCFSQRLELKNLISASKNNVSEILFKGYVQKNKTFKGQESDSVVINQGEINWFGSNKLTFQSIQNGIDKSFKLDSYHVYDTHSSKTYKKDFVYYIFNTYQKENYYTVTILSNVDNQGE